MTQTFRRLIGAVVLSLLVPVPALAQRSLRWDRLDVAAHLDASGSLEVVETQTMVFDGEWNGGERRFDIRPRQKLTFGGIWRVDADGRHYMEERDGLPFVDDFAWVNRRTLRWRSRAAGDPPFANTTLRYEIRYTLSGILLQSGDRYTLDHDFAFRDRDGPIARFALRLTLDPAWRPVDPITEEYTAGPLPPGQSFVLTVPMQFAGAGTPQVLDLTRPPPIATGVPILLGFAVLAILWFFVREQMYGRFAPVPVDEVDEAWLGAHLLRYHAEVVGAAWDEWVGPPEVVALLARLEAEGKITSTVGKTAGGKTSMAIRLAVSRGSFAPHERALIDALFFDGRSETSTQAVQQRYRKTGFNPASVIEQELRKVVAETMPPGDRPMRFVFVSPLLFFGGLTLMLLDWFAGTLDTPLLVIPVILGIVVLGFGVWSGSAFRKHLEWGPGRALLSVVPTIVIVTAVAAFLWFYVGLERVAMPPRAVYGLLTAAAGLALASINAAKSRQRQAGMALRKRLTAARAFFISELRQPSPALRDEWHPWLLAFGLTKEMDNWSADTPATRSRSGTFTSSTSASSSPSGGASRDMDGLRRRPIRRRWREWRMGARRCWHGRRRRRALLIRIEQLVGRRRWIVEWRILGRWRWRRMVVEPSGQARRLQELPPKKGESTDE